LTAASSPQWAKETAEGGSGVTWRGFVGYVSRSLEAYRLDADIEVLKPADNSPATLTDMRRLLADNEQSDRDIVLAYFNQGVLTGDWDGPHISPIGAYDAQRRRVLVMDVDRQWYVPYWSGDEKLLEAMLRPTAQKFVSLEGETGGLIRVRKR
jgi:Phytochelatin synthase